MDRTGVGLATCSLYVPSAREREKEKGENYVVPETTPTKLSKASVKAESE